MADENPTLEDPSGPCVLDRAMALVSFLRAHCPWDRAQTPESLIKHLIEESHEVADAILREDPGGLRGELGDLLLNLAFQLVIAEEEEHFRREDVWEALDDKMRRRHPHLFDLGDAVSWEEAKEREDPRDRGALAGLPATLPPLAKATALGRRAGQVGFDWTDPAGALAKIHEEVDELAALLEPTEASGSVTTQEAGHTAGEESGGAPSGDQLEEEVGDLLFAVVNVSRHAGVDAATALARANVKFRRRFEAVETLAAARHLPMPGTSLEQLDALWDEVKKREDLP